MDKVVWQAPWLLLSSCYTSPASSPYPLELDKASGPSSPADQHRVHPRIWKLQVCRHSPHLPLSSRPSQNPKRPRSNSNNTSPHHPRRHTLSMAQRKLPRILQRSRYQCSTYITRDVHDFRSLRESGMGIPESGYEE
jgi:hypothetical protein